MRLAVVGAGISGLVAAYRLRLRFPDAEIVVADAADRVGGKLRSVTLAGADIDIGAEAFVGRRPEVPALLRELGLSDQLVHPSGARPLIWSEASAHPLPAGTLLGIPAHAAALAGLVDAPTLDRIDAEPAVPFHWHAGADVDVATLVGQRFGDQVVGRSVDPLLGGVYSGMSSSIGVRAAVPTLAAALDAGAASLTEAVGRALPPPAAGPVFGGVRDGYRALLDALVTAAGADVRLGTAVTRLEREGGRWIVDPLGAVDGVVLAVPAYAGLLPGTAGEAAAEIDYASSAVVALALSDDAGLPDNSGVLVASGEALRAKAFTLTTRKWPHLAQRGTPIVRASFGRAGDSVAHWSDEDLISAACADLAVVTGATIAPVDAVVAHWANGLPQYAPGHLDRVATIERGVAELAGLEVAGAYLGGVGVAACVASGTAAARRLAAGLES